MARVLTVEAVVAALPSPQREQVEVLRDLVREADPSLGEVVKWNAPSWVHDGEDRLTVNTRNRESLVKLVLHMGAARPEDRTAPPVLAPTDGIVDWSSDIRGVITFADIDDLAARRAAVIDVVRRWLAIPV